MGFVVLITWFAAVLLGLFMLAVWLIENDVKDQRVARSRLPVVVIASHMLLAATGLGVWVAYLFFERGTLAWTAIGILGGIAALGGAMFLRWIPVYREPIRLPGVAEPLALPAERNFPLVVVTAHGLLAVTTLVLALLTALGVGAVR